MKISLTSATLRTLVPVLGLRIVRADAQALESIKSQDELNKAIASLGAALFDTYNRCDLEKFDTSAQVPVPGAAF